MFEEGIYPYRIREDIAELYCTVINIRRKGDIVKVISGEPTIYFNPQITKGKGDLFIITSSYDIKYITKHTVFE